MLNDLELDSKALKSEIRKTFTKSSTIKRLQTDLNKFKEKVLSRRKQVKIYEERLENKNLPEPEKIKYQEFIKKVERIDGSYDRERRFIIKRAIMESFESMAHEINKNLLG